MAIEILDKGACIASFFVRFDRDVGDDGTVYLSGQGVSGIAVEGIGSVLVTLAEELPPLITSLDPAVDTVHLQVAHAVMNKSAPVVGEASIVTFTQIAGNRIRCQGFESEDNAPAFQSFWAMVFRVPLPAVASALVPAPPPI